ncbi:MAG TPA: hypothetical protein PLK30_04350 [Blastocatellia bacterium]|nr:hypothetical protein [Blastocatellia bacterium]
MKLTTSIRISFGLCLLSILAVFVSNLALMDIAHGESDLRLEWRIVQVSYAVFIVFHAVMLVTLARRLKQTRQENREQL